MAKLSRKKAIDKDSVKEWAEHLQNKMNYKVLFKNTKDGAPFLFAWIAPWQLRYLQSAEEWCIDSTHKTCESINDPKKDSYLYTIIIRSPVTNRGVPVCQFITDREVIPTLSSWLNWLKTNFILKVKRIMIECSPTEIAAINEVFGDNVSILLCHWHIKRAWETHLKKLVSE